MFDFLENIYFYFLLFGILILFFFLLRWFFKRKFDKPTEKYSKLEKEYKEIKNDFDKEKNRLNYILTNYKQKLQLLDTDTNNNQPNFNKLKDEDSEIQLKNLISEKESLEIEKQEFTIKNKKLWQQSVAIHKEKERIDQLKKEVEKRHKEVTDSIKYAQKIQTALLPSSEILNEKLPKHFIFWKPRDIVSGDFYWTRQIDNQLIIVAADCTGHGVPGAFMSMLGISFLNGIVNSAKHQAHEILEEMRRLVKESLSQSKQSESKDGMDMALCIVDFDKKTLYFSGANNPLFLVRDDELIVIKEVKNPIGIYAKEREFTSTEIDIQPNDTFYIFSDGFQDQFGGLQNRKYGTTNFKNFILDINQKKIPIHQQAKDFDFEFTNWKDTPSEKVKYQKQVDDILVIGFQI